jgi:hypothetical protein
MPRTCCHDSLPWTAYTNLLSTLQQCTACPPDHLWLLMVIDGRAAVFVAFRLFLPFWSQIGISRQCRATPPAAACSLQIHIIILHIAPEPLNNHVVQCPGLPVKTDLHLCGLCPIKVLRTKADLHHSLSSWIGQTSNVSMLSPCYCDTRTVRRETRTWIARYELCRVVFAYHSSYK